MPTYSKQYLLQYLQEKADELDRTPTLNDLQEDSDGPSSKPFYRHFESYHDAVQEAGLVPEYEFLTKDGFLNKIKTFHDQHDRHPTTDDFINNPDLPSHSVIYTHFDTIEDAVTAAGLEYRTPASRIERKYTTEQLIDDLTSFAEDLGRAPTIRDLELADRTTIPGAQAYKTQFGSWRNALDAAGLPQPKKGPNGPVESWSREKIIARFEQLADEYEAIPSFTDVENADTMPASATVYRYFDDWEELMQQVSVPYEEDRANRSAHGDHSNRTIPSKYDDDELVEYLQTTAEDLGHPPSIKELRRLNGPSVEAYLSRYDSYPDALEDAGFDASYRRLMISGYTKDQLLDAMRTLDERTDGRPSTKHLSLHDDLPSTGTIYNHFDTWGEALSKALPDKYGQETVKTD